MSSESPHVHRVERVDDIPVLLATLQRLKVDETLDHHFPSAARWKGELTFGRSLRLDCLPHPPRRHRLNQVQLVGRR